MQVQLYHLSTTTTLISVEYFVLRTCTTNMKQVTRSGKGPVFREPICFSPPPKRASPLGAEPAKGGTGSKLTTNISLVAIFAYQRLKSEDRNSAIAVLPAPVTLGRVLVGLSLPRLIRLYSNSVEQCTNLPYIIEESANWRLFLRRGKEALFFKRCLILFLFLMYRIP